MGWLSRHRDDRETVLDERVTIVDLPVGEERACALCEEAVLEVEKTACTRRGDRLFLDGDLEIQFHEDGPDQTQVRVAAATEHRCRLLDRVTARLAKNGDGRVTTIDSGRLWL